ncbi:sugar ABC transporter substrate-binding protein [Rhizobiaceae bacterium n13]|uniref:Sugar ABC transporter substrate-binding protein n=1 Tax=Ferirhizobium litorale TaxID=2927786 RepID=A0AAE3TZ11_9HYPH|nr:sugar ABC transporter substrate-binding protein [Fererhizobium litorale]MDI7860364.1 sugar ABC transporter substrate-binding protein [Fererhizobium litorale]MDI7920499.1 sugar ABC transporter substrate-binding protein [Fererhizobium litorale]
MYHKSILSRFAAAALAGASLFASTAAFAGEVTIWCWDPNFNVAIMKEAAARYTAKHPDTTFNIVDFAKTDVEQKLQTALSSGTTDALPDIVLIEDYGAQKYLQSFPGAFAPMSDKVDYSGFAPYKVQLMTLDDKVYGMPFDSGVTGLYYRRDYLEQAGFKPEDMQDLTWDRFIEIGREVEAKTGHKMMGLDVNDAGFIRILMQSAGGWYFDDDGNLSIEDNAALRAALETAQKIMKAGVYKPAAGWNDWVATFTSGDVATVTTGVWITGTVKAQADQAGKWGVAPIPKMNIEGGTHASNLGGSSWYVLESSGEKDEAIDFLNEIYAKDIDFYQKILVNQGAVGSLMAARTGAAYSEPDAFFGGEKVWQNFADWLAKVPPVNYGVFTNEVDTAVFAHLPSLAKDANIDDVLKAIHSQAEGQIQ